MGKLLITLSDSQEQWLRHTVAHQGLPGGVSELVRRAVDQYRDQQEEQSMHSPRINAERIARERAKQTGERAFVIHDGFDSPHQYHILTASELAPGPLDGTRVVYIAEPPAAAAERNER